MSSNYYKTQSSFKEIKKNNINNMKKLEKNLSILRKYLNIKY